MTDNRQEGLEIEGARAALFTSTFISRLEKSLQRLVGRSHSQILMEAGRDEGKRLYSVFEGSFEDKFKHLIKYLEMCSLGRITKYVIDTENTGASLVVEDSFFAFSYRDRFGNSPRPVCDFIRGLLRGMFESEYHREFVVREELCAAQGHSNKCRFSVFPAY